MLKGNALGKCYVRRFLSKSEYSDRKAWRESRNAWSPVKERILAPLFLTLGWSSGNFLATEGQMVPFRPLLRRKSHANSFFIPTNFVLRGKKAVRLKLFMSAFLGKDSKHLPP